MYLEFNHGYFIYQNEVKKTASNVKRNLLDGSQSKINQQWMSKVFSPRFAESLTVLSVSKISSEPTVALFRVGFSFFKTNDLNWKTAVKFGFLRNREHFLYCETVLGTQIKVCGNGKCCRNASRKRVFPQRFRVVKNLNEYSLLFRNPDRNFSPDYPKKSK